MVTKAYQYSMINRHQVYKLEDLVPLFLVAWNPLLLPMQCVTVFLLFQALFFVSSASATHVRTVVHKSLRYTMAKPS